MASNDREGDRLHLYLKPKTAAIFNEIHEQFNEETGAELSRQKFIVKLINDYAKSKNVEV